MLYRGQEGRREGGSSREDGRGETEGGEQTLIRVINWSTHWNETIQQGDLYKGLYKCRDHRKDDLDSRLQRLLGEQQACQPQTHGKIEIELKNLEKQQKILRHVYISYIIILDPNDDDYRAYVCNITPWLTPHFN